MRAVLILSLLFSCLSHAKQLTIAIGEYPPYASEASEQLGAVPKIIQAAFAAQNYSIKFEFMPWARSYDFAKKGKYDAAAFWFCVPERAKDFMCSDPLYYESTYFFFNKKKPLKHWRSLIDLQAFEIGATKGYSYTDEFWALANNGTLRVNTVITDIQNFKMLLKGRIELFPMAMLPAQYLLNEKLNKAEKEQIGFHHTPLLVRSSHLLFPKEAEGSKHLMKVFNQGLEKIKQSGEYESILSKRGTDTELFKKPLFL